MELSEVVDQFLIDCKVGGLTDQAISFYRKRLTMFVRKLNKWCKVTELEQVNCSLLGCKCFPKPGDYANISKKSLSFPISWSVDVY